MNENKIVDNTPTFFIKLNKETKKLEKSWEGRVYLFRRERYRIRFKVKIENEIQCPSKYYNYTEGWYVEEDISSGLYPPFFNILRTTNYHGEFETYTYWLLKLLGIHEIQKFDEQSGRADGFFKLRNLAVMYDSTLQSDFEKSKMAQVNNYCNELKSGKIEYGNKVTYVVHCQKQVWIITRGSPRMIKKVDEVAVKEVPIDEIIEIYRERVEENLSEETLESRLGNVSE
jgi:hypothetical protein